MATRSFIGIIEEDKIKGIYCHWDGYISHNGKILYKHYNNIDKIKELIELGGLSVLAPNIHPNKDKVHNFENYQDDVVVAYHRDRGDDKEILIFNNAKEIQDYIRDVWIDYTYIFKDNEWYVVENIDDNNMKFYKLSDLMNKKKLKNYQYIEYNMKAITQMNNTFINPYSIKKSIIPNDIDLYEEYRKIKRKESKYSAAIRKAIVEEVEKRLDNNIKK